MARECVRRVTAGWAVVLSAAAGVAGGCSSGGEREKDRSAGLSAGTQPVAMDAGDQLGAALRPGTGSGLALADLRARTSEARLNSTGTAFATVPTSGE